MPPSVLRFPGLVSLLPRRYGSTWDLPQLAGRLAELSGYGATATLTAACGLVLDAQRRGELVGWVTPRESTFYPPDFDASGVDLDSLIVIRAAHPSSAARSALQLLRSGAFGLIVVDFGPQPPPGKARKQSVAYGKLSPAQLSRLVGLTQKHGTAVVLLTEKPRKAFSLGSLVSLRAEVRRLDVRSRKDGTFEVSVDILKDKRRGPGQRHRELFHGPDGLC